MLDTTRELLLKRRNSKFEVRSSNVINSQLKEFVVLHLVFLLRNKNNRMRSLPQGILGIQNGNKRRTSILPTASLLILHCSAR